jgi:hypothetical protein
MLVPDAPVTMGTGGGAPLAVETLDADKEITWCAEARQAEPELGIPDEADIREISRLGFLASGSDA